MKKLKTISLLLSLSLLASLVIPVTLATTTRAVGEQENSGMIINKTATANTDGTYTIQLEAFATGDKVITETTKDVPTDIVLVLDQSGSMEEKMNTYSFQAYSGKDNGDYYSLRHNGSKNPNLYYQLEDGSYATVSVLRTQAVGTYTYTECPSSWKNDESGSWGNDPDDYWKNSQNLYVKSIDGTYQKVELTRESVGVWYSPTYTYTYIFPDGSTVVSEGSDSYPNFGGKGPLYVRSAAYTYTYTYTDSEGQTKTIGTSEGANTQPTDFTLYERYSSSNTTRLAALQTAVTNFADSVATKAAGEDGVLETDDDVNHRIAVVGFASGSVYGGHNYNYGNTEVFIGSDQFRYGDSAVGVYTDAFQSMDSAQGKSNVSNSIKALDAEGGTIIDLGMEMANGILKANPVPVGEKRSRVVIVFTDGTPGWSGYDDDVANAAIREGETAKVDGVTVYTVGIFNGADATSAGIAEGNGSRRENLFMQKLSSNNGTPQSPSYYLSASDADTLNSIFQQISQNIESGGSSTTLGSETVIKDIVASQFKLPDDVTVDDITLETYACTGKDGDTYTWSKNDGTKGAAATVSGGQVSVTGFDFAANYVGTVTENNNVTYRGHKLVIKFNVEVKDGFLGGNNVYTNTSAGVYENSSATEPVLEFNRPQVNVAIEDVTVTAADKNVYLLSNLTADQIKDGATVKCGDVALDLSKANQNYDLQDWQTEYVDITVEIKDEAGNVVTDPTSLSDDTTYTVSAKVSPKIKTPTSNQGTTATEKTGTDRGEINVFKPELTYKDSTVYYGDTVPANYTDNLTSTMWKHGTTEDSAVTMIGRKPTLEMTYTPDSTKIDSGKVNTKKDIVVDVDVKIGNTDITDKTTFTHTACDANCTDPVNGGKFWLHVKTCQLTITKTGGAGDESYVFDVYKDGKKYTEISVWGNGSVIIYELPVGSYTIQENEGWSWRYNANNGSVADLTAQKSTGSITCNNTKTENYWLNGFSTIVKNIFDVANNEGGD